MNKFTISIFLLFCLSEFSYSQEKPKTPNLEKRANASVFKKLYKGVNIDTSNPENGVWFKVQHEPEHFAAAVNAGFESVRIFMPFQSNIESKEAQIKDALGHNLAVVVCMWGSPSWSKKDITKSAKQIAERWGKLAKLWKQYPSDLVFEILNEPAGIGFKGGNANKKVMELYNAAVQAIRNEDPDRPILIGCPGWNDSTFLDPYVTEEYLTYTYDGDKGFYDDVNAGVAIHFYSPKHTDGINFSMWTQSLKGANWKPPILDEITHAAKWRERIGINIPIITSEWGCWLFPKRPKNELNEWLDYHMSNFEKYDIGNMWYTGIVHNQGEFAIFNSELGWNQTVLDKLTGIKPATLPKTSQIINGEFFNPDFSWYLSTEKIMKEFIYDNEALSSASMLKVTVPPKTAGQLYQQTFKGDDPNKRAPGRTLLHLIEGQTYKLSFMAKSEDGKGQIKIRLKSAKSMDLIYDSYDADNAWIEIGSEPGTYTRLYTHNADDEMDVRLELDIGSKEQVLYLDKVEFVRN